MNARFGAELPDACLQSLDSWLRLWDVPHLEAKSRIEWSPRLTRSLGRCYPDRRLIRIASYLQGLEGAPPTDFSRKSSATKWPTSRPASSTDETSAPTAPNGKPS